MLTIENFPGIIHPTKRFGFFSNLPHLFPPYFPEISPPDYYSLYGVIEGSMIYFVDDTVVGGCFNSIWVCVRLIGNVTKDNNVFSQLSFRIALDRVKDTRFWDDEGMMTGLVVYTEICSLSFSRGSMSD